MVAKSNKYTILIVILSVLLAISLIVGSTFAWFASSDSAGGSIVLGDPVRLSIVDANNQIIESAGSNLPITIAGSKLLPGMQVNILARVLFDISNTPALLRARITVDVEDSTASGSDITFLKEQLNDSLHGSVAASGEKKWVFYDGWWYYLGANPIDAQTSQSIMGRIDSTSDTTADRTVDFISNAFIFPINVGNTFAKSSILFAVDFQAVQGYLPAYDEPALIGENEFVNGSFTGFRVNKISNVGDIFNEAFA